MQRNCSPPRTHPRRVTAEARTGTPAPIKAYRLDRDPSSDKPRATIAGHRRVRCCSCASLDGTTHHAKAHASIRTPAGQADARPSGTTHTARSCQRQLCLVSATRPRFNHSTTKSNASSRPASRHIQYCTTLHARANPTAGLTPNSHKGPRKDPEGIRRETHPPPSLPQCKSNANPCATAPHPSARSNPMQIPYFRPPRVTRFFFWEFRTREYPSSRPA